MLALQEYAKPSSATSVHGEKLMSALQEYATSRNAKWLHGEKVDVCIVTSIQYPAGLRGRLAKMLMRASHKYVVRNMLN